MVSGKYMVVRRKPRSRSRPRRRVNSRTKVQSKRAQSKTRRAPRKRSNTRSQGRRRASVARTASRSPPALQPVVSPSPVRVVRIPPQPPLPSVSGVPNVSNVSDAALKVIRVHIKDYVYETQRMGQPIVFKEMIDFLEDVISENPVTSGVSLAVLKQIVASELARQKIKAR